MSSAHDSRRLEFPPRRKDWHEMPVSALWERLNDPQQQPTAQSTINAFYYVLRQNNPKQLQAWLGRRSPDERVAFKNLLSR